MRFCRSLGALDEATNTARHALYLINRDGDLVFRQDNNKFTKMDFNTERHVKLEAISMDDSM